MVDAGLLMSQSTAAMRAETLGCLDPLLDHVEDHVARGSHLVHTAHDLADG